MEITIYSTIVFICVVIILSLATVVFFEDKRPASRIFSGLAVLYIAWIIVELLFHQTVNFHVANFLIHYSHYLGGIVASAFFYFTLVFPENKYPNKKIFAVLVLLQIIFLFFYKENLIIGNVFPVDGLQGWGWNFGPLRFIFYGTFFGFSTAGLWVLYRKSIKEADTTRKNKLTRLLFIIFMSLLPITLVTVILPVFGIFTYGWIGSFCGLGWMLSLAYFLIKDIPSNTQAISSEIFIFGAAIILFANVLIGETSDSSELISPQAILRTIVFIAFFMVGYLLIMNTIRESEQKEHITRLNSELDVLNQELAEKVTERTEELNISKKHIEIILENLTIGIIEYDATFKVLRINEATEHMLGVTRDEVSGKTISIKETGRLQPLAKIMYDWQSGKAGDDVEDGGIMYDEVELTQPKHQEIQVITVPIRTIPLIKITGFIKLLRDVTYENAVDRGKNNFISIVAHQLNAPLEATEWALEKVLSSPLSEKQKEMMLKAVHSNENLLQITTDLLTAARIDGNEFTVQLEKNDLIQTVDGQIEHFRERAFRKKIDLIFNNLAEQMSPFLFDRAKIEMALRNILANAIDYTPEGGRVVITLGEVTSDGFASITIKDTGIGIPKEELDRIFTKFYRSRKALLMETDRSGLGLYITKNIIDGHKGTIVIDSVEGAGVTVSIRIPIQTEIKVPQ